ncbi:hypothetical protein [Streptomyces sp. NPDC041003]|uniref:hypothetical protein n=1 Tax=Streptomyces sp. NPDC041003 TaxID=3155730 RepID=UPI0033D35FFE
MQYIVREGALPGRADVQEMPGGDIQRVRGPTNACQRRDRLDQAQLAVLTQLGIDWAQ